MRFWPRLRPRRVLWAVLPFVLPILLTSVWVAYVQLASPPPGILPGPIAVLRVPLTEADYWSSVSASIDRLLMGFILAAVTAIPVGIAVGMSQRVSEVLDPLVTSMSALSGVAWIPLALAWFGPGEKLGLFIIWNAAFFPIFISTVLGARLTPARYRQAVTLLGASRREIATSVVLPAAAPNIVGGLRTGLSFGWRALVTAELIGAAAGIGQLMIVAREFVMTNVVIAGVLTIGVIGISMDRLLFVPIERRTVGRWRPDR